MIRAILALAALVGLIATWISTTKQSGEESAPAAVDHLNVEIGHVLSVEIQDQTYPHLDRLLLLELQTLGPCRLRGLQPVQSYEARRGLYWILLDCERDIDIPR